MIDEEAIRLAVLADNLDEVDYYALLEVPREVGVDAVRDAFHQFALRFHPDQHVGDAARQRKALAIFKRGAEAYRVLMNPALRRRYDAALAAGALRLPAEESHLPPDGVDRTRGTASLPPGARPFYDKAVEALRRGELGSAKMHLALAVARGDSPLLEQLAGEIRAARGEK